MSDIQADDGAVDQAKIEREARRSGWRPQEEFRGEADDWVDAATYVRRGREIRAHSKGEIERLRTELAARDASIAELRETIEEVREYHAQMEERAIAAAIERMKKEKRAATAEGNTELAADIQDEIDELKEAPRLAPKAGKKDEPPKGQTTPPPQPQEPPQITQWRKDNASWYNQDVDNEDMVAFVDGLAGRLMNRQDLTLEEKLDTVNSKVRAMFPDRFDAPVRRTAPTAGAGEGGGPTRRSNDPVASLPDDAKAAGARFVKQGLYKDMKAYAEEYWNQPAFKNQR